MMEHKKINPQQSNINIDRRPQNREDFIGQKDVKQVLQTAILSAKKRNDTLGHTLFSGSS
jgi:Holliday junction resolvasome RuvABC ATP-dependent DNA helicase subunit